MKNQASTTSTFFIGIDISKLTLDVAVLDDNILLNQYKIENSEISIKSLLTTLKSAHQCTPTNAVFCAEQMGLYAKFLLNVFARKKVRVCMESPLQIKLSLGIQRGKNDALDALLIARYAQKNYSSLKFWQPPRPSIIKLQSLASLRKRLVKVKVMLQHSKTLEAHFLSFPEKEDIDAYSQRTLDAIRADIKRVEREIDATITADKRLNNLVRIMTSIPHIGKVIASELIIHTNEFKDIDSAKKFACYCGIAPFARTSGTSLNRKPRISHYGNKEIKNLLHMATLGTIRRKKTKLYTYYLRKKEEGKSTNIVLNAMRNKLVHYIFACVRENKLYEETITFKAAPILSNS